MTTIILSTNITCTQDAFEHTPHFPIFAEADFCGKKTESGVICRRKSELRISNKMGFRIIKGQRLPRPRVFLSEDRSGGSQ
jgi:hypothetical protein